MPSFFYISGLSVKVLVIGLIGICYQSGSSHDEQSCNSSHLLPEFDHLTLQIINCISEPIVLIAL